MEDVKIILSALWVATRQYLSDAKTREMLKRLNQYLEGMVNVPRVRIGNRQTIETLINEEALLLAKFLRDEKGNWTPRIPSYQVNFLG